jgi:hypothetical protein
MVRRSATQVTRKEELAVLVVPRIFAFAASAAALATHRVKAPYPSPFGVRPPLGFVRFCLYPGPAHQAVGFPASWHGGPARHVLISDASALTSVLPGYAWTRWQRHVPQGSFVRIGHTSVVTYRQVGPLWLSCGDQEERAWQNA